MRNNSDENYPIGTENLFVFEDSTEKYNTEFEEKKEDYEDEILKNLD